MMKMDPSLALFEVHVIIIKFLQIYIRSPLHRIFLVNLVILNEIV